MSGSPHLVSDVETIDLEDLEAAIADGVIERERAEALLAHASRRRATPSPTVDEEDVRLVTSFNDLFVTIGIALTAGSMVALGATFAPMLTAPAVAALAWGLAEIFTRRRRMAFPSLVLAVLFVCAAAASVVIPLDRASGSAVVLAGGFTGLLAGFVHWRRFRVPIAMAALTAGGVGIGLGLASIVVPDLMKRHVDVVALLAGLAVFVFAMRWDLSDPARRTRRSDVAFWLHVLAAPLIVHPLAGMTGAGFGFQIPDSPWPVLAMFAALAAVAIVVDRRALLVSGLAYFGGSILVLIERAGWSGQTLAATTVGLVGTSVIVLSIAWTPLRDLLLHIVPAPIRARVPAPSAFRGSSS